MCRLLGYAAPVPRTVEAVLGGSQSRVFQDMAKLHRDGWGSSWINESSAVQLETVKQNTSGLGDRQLMDALSSQPSSAKIIHLRMATGGMSCAPENTHPFISGNISFAHNGSFPDLRAVDDLLSPAIRDGLIGDTDSERYFGLIRTNHERGLPLREATAETARVLRAMFPASSFNALILSGTQLIAVHAWSGTPSPLGEFDRRGINFRNLPADHLAAYYLMRVKRHEDGSVIFASSGLDIEGWDALPHDSVTSVDLGTLEYETVALQ